MTFSEDLAKLKKRCPWPSERPFSPHVTIARIAHPQGFAIAKKKIMKQLQDLQITMPVRLLRLSAEIDGRKQTPLRDFPFGGT